MALPADLPLGVPSQLVERRPDVRAAEAQLHAATAQVGVATANMLPQLTITGSLGSSATLMSDLFKGGTGFWTIGADASADAVRRAARCFTASAPPTPRWTRPPRRTARPCSPRFKTSRMPCTRWTRMRTRSRPRAAPADAAEKSLGVARHQLELGSVSYLALLSAEHAYQQAVVSLAQARSNRYADTAALFQALGGSISPVAH